MSSSWDSGSTSGSSSRVGSSTSNISVNNKTGNDGERRSSQGKPNATYPRDVPKKQTEPKLSDPKKQQLVKDISIGVKSSRRKTQRVRIRPCLDVCQTVEQKCPYMLPGDRAPALPTQYAGEPTFLCRDLNIEETGEQLLKSNSGPTECCYDYCGSIPQLGVCARCDPLLLDDDDDSEEDHTVADMRNDSPTSGKASLSNSTSVISRSSSINYDESSSSRRRNLLGELRFSSELPPRLATCPSITSATTPSSPSEQCKSAQQLLLQRQPLQQQSNNADVISTSVAPSSASTVTAVTTTTTTPAAAAAVASSSASSLASSSSLIKLTSIKSIYNVYFNNSWTMRLRFLDEFVAWTKILLQLAGL